MFDTFTGWLDLFGIIVFATTGALVASRKQMDIVGFITLGTAAGIGGGTLRDVLLGLYPVFWVAQPHYLATCVIVSCLAFFLAHIPQSRYRLLLWFDAVGMALFAVTGAERAMLSGVSAWVSISMGVVTATFGGILRDLLGGEKSIILRPEIYLTAALCGASSFVGLSAAGLERDWAVIAGLATGAGIRFAALQWNWKLPRYRPRPPLREPDQG